MICLTGDVHHDSLGTNEQTFMRQARYDTSEVAISVEYVRLCERYGVKCTLYTTGKTLATQWDAFKPAAQSGLVEVGGHTFGGLPRARLSGLRARLTGGVSSSHAPAHGSRARQRRDIAKMLEIARQRLGRGIVSWRSHGLVRDAHTEPLLHDAGIRYISDELNWEKRCPEMTEAGLVSHPINALMDHDHVYHAHRTPEYVARQMKHYAYQDDPTRESYTVEAWGDIVEEQVAAITRDGGLATVLMHPVCMYVADRFATMERLLKRFAPYESIWACEAGGMLAAGSGSSTTRLA